MSAFRTKIQTHKILFIAIAIAILVAIGIGAFFPTNALAENENKENKATFKVQITNPAHTGIKAKDFKGSKVYFLSTDLDSESGGCKQTIFEGIFDDNGCVRFYKVDVGEKAYGAEGLMPVVYGGYATVNASDGTSLDYCIETKPVPRDIAFGHNDADLRTLDVEIEECSHYNLKVNNGNFNFKCRDLSSDQIKYMGKNIPAPKGSKIEIQRNICIDNKAYINVRYEDKVVYSYEVEAEGCEILSIFQDWSKLGISEKDVRFNCRRSLQSNGKIYLPVFAGTAKEHEYKFSYMDKNNNKVPLDGSITMEGLRPYIGNLYVEEGKNPCIAVRSINHITFDSVYGQDGIGARTVDENWKKEHLVRDGAGEYLETVERLMEAQMINQTPKGIPPKINGVELATIWKSYNPNFEEPGFGSAIGCFLSCVTSDTGTVPILFSLGSVWLFTKRGFSPFMCVCVSRAF